MRDITKNNPQVKTSSLLLIFWVSFFLGGCFLTPNECDLLTYPKNDGTPPKYEWLITWDNKDGSKGECKFIDEGDVGTSVTYKKCKVGEAKSAKVYFTVRDTDGGVSYIHLYGSGIEAAENSLPDKKNNVKCKLVAFANLDSTSYGVSYTLHGEGKNHTGLSTHSYGVQISR